MKARPSPSKPAHARRRARAQRRSGERGQAMLEYSLINWLLILALVVGATTVHIKTPDGNEGNILTLFLRAFQTYYDSFYFVLNLPFP